MKTNYKQYSPLRNNRGAAVIGLCLALSSLLLFLAYFVYDMNRMQMAQRQLSALSDAAAVAGSAMLTAKDVSYEDSTLDTLYTTQLAAEQYAKNMFCMGNILGQQLYDPAAGTAAPTNGIKVNSVGSAGALPNTTAGTVNLLVRLCAPVNNYAIVAPGTSNGRAVMVQANLGYKPYLNMLGVLNVQLPSTSTSGLQKLAVIMVFDCSGSMDDNTVVTFVERRWTTATAVGNYPGDSAGATGSNGGRGQYSYDVVGTPNSGQLWDYTGLNYANQPNGTALNVLPPQNLDFLGKIYENAHVNYSNSGSDFTPTTAPLALDYAIRSYVCWPAGTAFGSPNRYNYNYISYGNNGVNSFQGPYYDNDFGTPPGNCTVKYGAAAVGAVYGTTSGSPSPRTSLNTWDNIAAHAPGPGASPGYRYYPSGPPPANNHDGNLYFYDPYSMPGLYSGTSYTPFTDLVANLTTPGTQPIYGSSPFSGLNYTFSSGTFVVSFAEDMYQPTGQVWNEPDNAGNASLSGKTFKFSSVAYLVEASRGNLDLDNNGHPTNYDNALLSFGNCNGFAQPAKSDCAYGYQKAYQRLAMFCSQPYATAVDGAYRFFQNLTATSASCFGFVGFSVAPTSNRNYVSAYLPCLSGWGSYYSLGLAAPTNPARGQSVYSSWIYESKSGTNPNFWVTTPVTCSGSWWSGSMNAPSGPSGGSAGTGAGIAYNATYNTNPSQATWLSQTATSMWGSSSSAVSNDNTMYAFNNPGFQIPRYGNQALFDDSWGSDQQYTFWGSAGNCWSYWDNYTGDWGSEQYYPACGCGEHGLSHTRPLYDTQGLEALEVALYNLTSISKLDAILGYSSYMMAPPTLGPGTKNAIVFFTDGVPTDDSGAFSSYVTNVVNPAQQNGVAIYSIGLALNSAVKITQSTFLQTLTNKGASGSQYFQITSNANLTSVFTGIARQLAQAQH